MHELELQRSYILWTGDHQNVCSLSVHDKALEKFNDIEEFESIVGTGAETASFTAEGLTTSAGETATATGSVSCTVTSSTIVFLNSVFTSFMPSCPVLCKLI